MESVYIDLSSYFDDNEDFCDLEVGIDQFNDACSDLVTRFRTAVNDMCETIQQFGDCVPIAKVIPVGGGMRLRSLQEALRATVESVCGVRGLSFTLNMDECATMGATTFAHLLDTRCVKLDPALIDVCVFSQDPVEWSAFSSRESDCEICVRSGARVDQRHSASQELALADESTDIEQT